MPAGICSKNLFLMILVLSALFFPFFINAQVVINEVQILPTGNKFLELHNAGDSSVNLTGWYIKKKTASGAESTLVVTSRLENKSISAKNYFLIANENDYIGGAVLDAGWPQSNTGVASNNTVILYDNNNVAVDKVGWGTASDCPTPCPPNPPTDTSIQRTAFGWIVASPTPRLANTTGSTSTSTATSTSSTATSTDDTTATSTSSGTTTTSDQSSSSSTHYSSAPVSSRKSTPDFEVSAGRDRLGSVGSPLEFEVETNIEYTKNSIFIWNFGDGGEAVGEIVNHTYMYPGDYIVVLNVAGPRGKAVSRANVKIVDPLIEITDVSPERIEITNNSQSEISLFGRALVTSDKIFSFSKDTIIKAGQKISFDANITGLSPLGKKDVILTIIGKAVKPSEIIAKAEEQKLAKIASIRQKIAVLERQRLAIVKKNTPNSPTVIVVNEKVSNPTPETNKIQEALSQTASVIVPISTSTPNTPDKSDKWFDVFKRFLLRTR